MELDHIHLAQPQPQSQTQTQTQTQKYCRVNSSKIGLSCCGVGGASVEDKIRGADPTKPATPMNSISSSTSRFGRQWQNSSSSSRIIRVSRASGGKDRHSKVLTAKGPRDRRVRLSVNTAIQFYDLQDRLGYDQPSKAVEWLIKAAAESINELPSLDSAIFPPQQQQQQQQLVLCSHELRSGNNNVVDSAHVQMSSSNNSETSKGSGLSLSRTEIRVKARERARERTAKEKKEMEMEMETEMEMEMEMESEPRVSVAAHHPNNNAHNSSFTQLLTAGITNLRENVVAPTSPTGKNNTLQWLSSTSSTTTSMPDYLRPGGVMGLTVSRSNHSHSIHHLGDAPLPHVMALLPFTGSTSNEIQHHQQQQQFPFLIEQHHHHHHPTDFPMSSSSTTSGVATAFNRGTLQSNSSSTPSFLPYFQRFSTTDSGPSVPFFLGGAPISPIVDNQQHQHYHHDHQFNPAGLELSYGNGGRHSEQKGKGKN